MNKLLLILYPSSLKELDEIMEEIFPVEKEEILQKKIIEDGLLNVKWEVSMKTLFKLQGAINTIKSINGLIEQNKGE